MRSREQWHPNGAQMAGMKGLIEHAAAILIAEPGLGKTSTVYGAFKVLRRKKLARKMLVVAPLKPCWLVWGPEQRKWQDFSDIRVEILHGPGKGAALEREADVYVINPDGLDWLLDVQYQRNPKTKKVRAVVDVARFKKFGFDTLVIDELTRFKHRDSNRHQSLAAVLETFARRWGLTGTPNPNGLMDLFGQCFMIDLGLTFGRFITHFRNRYFVRSYDGFTWTLREGAAKEIYERLAPIAMVFEAKDYIDMPEVVERIIPFDLPRAAREMYDDLEKDLFAMIDEEAVIAANAGVASMKCRQVACGGIYLDGKVDDTVKLPSGKRRWIDLHHEKIDIVDELIKELNGSPLLVAYDFHHDLARLRERFGDDVPVLGGGMSIKKMREVEAAWNTDQYPIMLAQPQSTSLGLNLQGGSCCHVCWHSLTWDWEIYDQFVRRVRRQGSKFQRVFVHHIVAKHTVDEAQLSAVRAKGVGQAALFAALQRYRASKN